MPVLALILGLAPQDTEHFPLKEGTTWSYRMSSGQSMEVKVAGSSNVGGQACVVLETALGAQKSREHLALTAEGLTAFRVESAAGALDYPTPILRAKLPFRNGDAWTLTLQEGSRLNTYRYRTEGPERVTTPAGEIEAWKVVATLQLPEGEAVMRQWYAKGLGLVKQVYESGGRTMTAELASSSLLPAGPRRCAKCGAPDKAAGKFCAECGTPFP